MATERLPRADDAERYLITCIMGWPDRAAGILPLVKPSEFFEPLYQKIWRSLVTQLTMTGSIDLIAVGREHKCSDHLLALGYDATTTAHAESRAEMVRNAAQARALYELLHRGAEAILSGRSPESVLAMLDMALEGFKQGAAA